MVLIGGIYATRVVWELGILFHRNPFATAGDLLADPNKSSVGQQAQRQQRINIAFYGYGGSDHAGGYLADSIMVVSILPHSGGQPQVAEVSIPRDWYVPIDLGNGHRYFGRINESYSDGIGNNYPNRADVYKGDLGGGTLANATLQKLLGIHIDHFVGIDFHAFQYAVDAVGGIDVVVPHTFTDYTYPHGECDRGDCGYMTVHFDAGPQHMDGRTALIFSRSRHSSDNGEGTDFARSRRQQLVMQALKQKVASVGGIGKLPDVLAALGDHVTTDLTIPDARALYDLVKGVDSASVEHVSIDDTNFLYECGGPPSCAASYLFAHDTTYKWIGRYVQQVFPPPAALAAKVPVTVYDASGRGGGASARWAALLGEVKMAAKDGGRQATSATTHVILTGTGDAATKAAQYLASLFGVAVERPGDALGTPSGAPSSSSFSSSAVAAPGVALVLGADEEKSFNGGQGSGYYSSAGGSGYSGTYTARPRPTPTRSTSTTSTSSTTTETTTTTESTTSSTSSILPPVTSSSSTTDSSSSKKADPSPSPPP